MLCVDVFDSLKIQQDYRFLLQSGGTNQNNHEKNLTTPNTEGTTEGILEQKIIRLRGSKASFNSCRKPLFRRNLFSSVSTVEETVLFPMKREIPLIKSSSPGPSNENSTPHALVSKRKSIFILFYLFFPSR